MSKLLFLSFLFCLTNHLLAENVLVLCNSNLLPEQDTDLTKNLQSTMIDAIFSQAFDKGHIVYDAEEKNRQTASSTALTNIAKKYKSDKIIIIDLVWKETQADEKDLDHVTYTLSDAQGNILCQGKIFHQESISLAHQLTEKLNLFY